MKSFTKSLRWMEDAMPADLKERMPDEWFDQIKQQHPKTIAYYSKPFYAYYYLGLDVPFHQFDWYYQLDRLPQTVLLAPRDHGKTTSLPRVIAEHDTLFKEKYNILLISKTATQAQKSLDVIAKDLTTNPRIQRDFAFELSDYRKVKSFLFFNLHDLVQRDATIESNGLLGDITGGHFHKIIMDDIIDDANTRTPKARKDTWKWISGTVQPLLEPNGRFIGIGTRKHYDDVYQKFIENLTWHVIEQKAILTMPDSWDFVIDPETGVAIDVHNIQGASEVLWEEKWTIKHLLLKMKSMGKVLFFREYQNDTSQMQGTILKEPWLKYYSQKEENAKPSGAPIAPPRKAMTIYQGVDLAIGKKEKNDYFVLTTIGTVINPYRIYVLDWFRDKISFPEQVEIIKNKFTEYTPERIGIEANAYQRALGEQVIWDKGLPVEQIFSTNDKTARIQLGSIHYENRLVHVPHDHPVYDAFIDEYRLFDEGEHDDIVDSMDIAMRTIHKPKTKKRARSAVVEL